MKDASTIGNLTDNRHGRKTQQNKQENNIINYSNASDETGALVTVVILYFGNHIPSFFYLLNLKPYILGNTIQYPTKSVQGFDSNLHQGPNSSIYNGR